jgi:hypothetical protein
MSRDSTIVALPHPFVCRATTCGFAHRIVLHRPVGVDALGRYRTIKGLCGQAELYRYTHDQLTDRPELARVVDEDGPSRIIPISKPVWDAIAYSNGGEAIARIIAAILELVMQR